MPIKDRKVFSIKNFRGLDKENKLLKVADFRASDGENFIIDSETLKTRPAITHKDTLPFDIEVADKFVASYKFREVEIFITKLHIYIYDGNSVTNEKQSNVLAQGISSFNFEGQEPLFREEKDCLFIFNVGYIYVFSILRDLQGKIYKYVLYPLSSKPSNPFGVNDYYYKKFEDLPLPYEPTIFIGDNRYEDINLLSKVTKYKLFASNRDAKDGKTTYMLPTVYEEAKHGYYGFAISFYQNKFAEHGIYPIFLGRKGEDIDENINEIEINYGSTLNEDGIEIEDVFFPKEDFIFTVDPENITTLDDPTKVSDIVGVTKEWFFKAKVREGNKQVFTYILDYINYDQSLAEPLIDGNKTLKFSLPIKYNAVYKESGKDNTVVARKVEETTVDIYVQLKLYAVDQTLFTNKTVYPSQKITEYDLIKPYPEYETVSGTFTEIELSPNPIKSRSFTNATFENMVNTYLRQHQEDYTNGQALKIKAKLYDGSSVVQEQLITVNSQESWIYREISNMINDKIYVSDLVKEYNPNNNNDFPAYPYVPGTFIERNLYEEPQQVENFSQEYFRSLCEAYILAHESEFEDGEKVKLRAQFKDYYNEVTPESITPEAYTLWKHATFPEMASNNEYLSSKINVLPNNPDYPAYPTEGSAGYHVIDLPNHPKLKTGYTKNDFIADCQTYINENPAEFTDGQLVKFRGRYYEMSMIETDEVVNAETSGNWVFRELNDLLDTKVHSGLEATKVNPSDTFPAYPNVSTAGRTVIDLGSTEMFSSFTGADAIEEVNDYFDNNFESLNDNQLLYFQKRLYQRFPWSTTDQAIVNPYYTEWLISEEDTNFSWGYIDSIIDYPSYEPKQGEEVVQVGLLTQSGKTFNYGSTTLHNQIKDAILADINDFQGWSGNGVAYVKLQTLWDDQGNFYEKAVAFIVPFTWTKGVDEGYVETRRSYVVTAEVQKGVYDKKVTLGQISTFPKAPIIDNQNGYPVIDLGISHTVVGTSIDFTSPAIKNAIEAGISSKLSQLSADSGYVYAITRVQLDHTSGSVYDKGATFAVLVYYAKQAAVTSESRQSMISLVEIQRNIYDKKDITLNAPETFPAYPTFSNPNGYQVLDYGIIHTDNVENVDFSNPTLLSNLENAISTNIENITANFGYIFAKFKVQTSYNDGENVKGYSVVARVQFEKYSEEPYENRQSMIMTLDIDRVIHTPEITINDPLSYPAYPEFDNTSLLPVLDLGIVYTGTSQFIDFNSVDLLNAIESEILENINTLENNSGNAFARIKVQNSYNNGSKTVNTGASLVVGFYFQKYVSTPYEVRQSFVMTTVVDKDQQMAEEGVYEYTFDDKEKAFVVKVRDYFFDYNDEPSIEVKITFQNNPDYKLISDCKFGATFGSENRLFLAGNPNYPNIDRYNVSNDLLGDNVRNQSYELTYFPSKNYRVLGGKGAINGYVVATDSHLYITKENYPNDEKLFIRERILDENGVVGYHEYKTSVKKSPLNNKCIVRFYNDILILSEDGLHGIEISSNVLTDERLIKPRDGFIKRDLVNAIKNYDHSKIFMVENDIYLYIFIGDDIYVADSRYLAKNEDGEVGNFSYEIVKWKAPTTYLGAKIEERYLELIQHDGKALYHLENGKDYDDLVVRHNDLLFLYTIQGMDKNAFILPETHMYIKDNPQDYVFKLKQGFKVIGVEGVDYHIDNGMVIVDNSFAFRNISDGEKVYFKENAENDFVSIEVSGYNEDGLGFPYTAQLDLDLSKIYMNIAELPLKVSLIFEFNNTTYFRLTPFTPNEVPFIKQENNETTVSYLERLNTYLVDNQDYIFTTEGHQDCYINKPTLVQTRWVSAITDLRSNLMEKTMFRANIYATRQSKGGSLVFGYKTMRKGDYIIKDTLDIANQNSLEALNFNHFGFSTFSEMGASFPLKENNFLYIQFEIVGTGQIELNSIEIIYKLNRLLKSIG